MVSCSRNALVARASLVASISTFLCCLCAQETPASPHARRCMLPPCLPHHAATATLNVELPTSQPQPLPIVCNWTAWSVVRGDMLATRHIVTPAAARGVLLARRLQSSRGVPFAQPLLAQTLDRLTARARGRGLQELLRGDEDAEEDATPIGERCRRTAPRPAAPPAPPPGPPSHPARHSALPHSSHQAGVGVTTAGAPVPRPAAARKGEKEGSLCCPASAAIALCRRHRRHRSDAALAATAVRTQQWACLMRAYASWRRRCLRSCTSEGTGGRAVMFMCGGGVGGWVWGGVLCGWVFFFGRGRRARTSGRHRRC